MLRIVAPFLLLAGIVAWGQVPNKQKVDSNLMANGQFLKPIGDSLTLPARPIAIAVHPNGRWVYVKEDRGLSVIDAATWKTVQELASPGGTSYTGLLLDKAGKRMWLSNAASTVHEGTIGEDGKIAWTRKLDLPKPKIGGEAYPCGMALDPSESKLFVCGSRANEIDVFSLADGKVASSFPTDIAPFDCALSPDMKRLYVSCWGGKRPVPQAKTADSAGTQVEVDERGIAKAASLAVHILADRSYTSLATGLQPSEVVVGKDGRAYVANANGDTVTIVSSDLAQVKQLWVKPDDKLPFGSQPNALALDGDSLYVACGGSNAVAVVDVAGSPKVKGFLPTGWFPAGVAIDRGKMYIANSKGTGARRPESNGSFSVYSFTGSVQRVDLATLRDLPALTETVRALNATKEIVEANSAVTGNAKPVPVPARLGDPSVFKHVVYVLKENRTYDQVLGDMKKGDGDPRLCMFGQDVTPNHHALADQYVLLDNYYCNGVNSADGHAWSMEGNATSHFERSFGGFTRSYPFGDDPLSPSSSGFVWDNLLRFGKTFHNFGEFDYASVSPNGSWKQVYDDWAGKTGKYAIKHNIGVERLRGYSEAGFPGWDLGIPDQIRADIFVKYVGEAEKTGIFPQFTILYLPNDHTSGTGPGGPTPRAQVADNDLALGRCVEALSKSSFWKDTVVFVIEDDPQNGFDHIDGHRSPCLVVSPYSRTGKVVKNFYNQTSVLHTMQQILGVPPLNQMDSRSPLMSACFVAKANTTPYACVPNKIPLNELNPAKAALNAAGRKWAAVSASVNLDKPDQMDLKKADQFNRAIWYSVFGAKPYPSKWVGAHGKGLKKRGLKLEGGVEKDDD